MIKIPPETINVLRITLQEGENIHRVHSTEFSETQFNPGFGNARFSPIYDKDGNKIPTIYGAFTVEVALMETVFHDLPESTFGTTFNVKDFNGRSYSVIAAQNDLSLASVSDTGARHLGISEHDLIHSSAAHYSYTRQWAEAIHHQHPDIQGMIWTSKQNSSDRAIMLYGDRVDASDLYVVDSRVDLLSSKTAIRAINKLTSEMGINIVDPERQD
ncbi:RES family NAD+ phosphorylase [Pseudidiomarina aestuarii]|uniref:RES family NAD+ phosphorylase n=1 Tax=Pseudidiomarina aestuarii TaxID=624146 RepID=UPI003A96A5BC